MANFPVLIQGDTPVDTWTIKDSKGNVIDLSGLSPSNIVVFFNNSFYPDAIDRLGTGTLTIINASQGIVQYVWSVGDSAILGTFNTYIRITDNSGHVNTYGPNVQQIVRA